MTEYYYRVDLGEVRHYLRRTAWGQFPDVSIVAEVPVAKQNPHYAAAKSGDAKAAEALVDDVLAIADTVAVRTIVGSSRPYLLPVHAVETTGMNAIPRVFARELGALLDLPVASGVIQINRVMHTGAGGFHRLAFPPVFDGDIEEVEYLLVDDFIGQGGTIANLRGHVESNNGKVVAAISLTGKAYSATIRVQETTLRTLREKHGRKLEEWWIATFGYGFDRLTESEARYLTRPNDVDTISARIIAARRAGDR